MAHSQAQTQQHEILLFGLGAVGAVYGFIMNQSPNALVTACARSNYQVVKDGGVNLQSEQFGNHPAYKFHNVVPAVADASTTRFAYVVCTNKATTVGLPASEQIAPAVTKDTTIVIIQNGIGIEDEFHKRFPENVIISGVVWVNTNHTTPGTIIHKGNERLQLGCHWNAQIDRNVQQMKVDAITQILREGGSNVETVSSIDPFRWKKMIWSCTWNTITALTLCSTSQFLNASSSGEIVARALVMEVATIARALGNEIDDDYLENLITGKPFSIPGIYSSMYVDVCNSRPIEVDAIVAGPLRKAKELKLATPMLETICALLSTVDWRIRNGISVPPAK